MDGSSKPTNQSQPTLIEANDSEDGTPDLSGDFQSMMNNLQFGLRCHSCMIQPPVSAMFDLSSASFLVPRDAVGSPATPKLGGTGAYIPDNVQAISSTSCFRLVNELVCQIAFSFNIQDNYPS